MKIFFTVSLFVIVLMYSSFLQSQTINARLSTYFYSWQRYDSLTLNGENPSTKHIRGYQNLLLELSSGKWSFNALTQTEEDIVNKTSNGFNYRIYNFFLKGNNLFNVLDFKFGRQWISAGAGKGSIDGISLKLKLGKNKEYQFVAYGGALTPMNYRAEEYPELKNHYSIGGQFLYYGIKNLTLGLSYNNKHRKSKPYFTIRADSVFNTKEYYVDIDSPADQIAGIDADYTDSKNQHNFYLKAYYDISRNKFLRGEINARFNLTQKLKLSAGFSYREPMLSYNSIFWVFNYSKNQEIEGGVDYLIWKNINIFAKVSNVFYKNSNSLKFQGGFNHPSFGASFVKYTGYSGESDGIVGYFYRDIYRSKLSVNVNLNYSRYKISEFTENGRITSLSGLLGFTFRPFRTISLDIQGQFIRNRIYKTDFRFLFGASYWLFNKF